MIPVRKTLSIEGYESDYFLRCLDNPSLQAEEIAQPKNLGCTIRCYMGCKTDINLSDCCRNCADDCVSGQFLGAFESIPFSIFVIFLMIILIGFYVFNEMRKQKEKEHRKL